MDQLQGLQEGKALSYIVEVVRIETQEVVRSIGPTSLNKAGLVQRGVLRNLDESVFFVQVVAVSNEPEALNWMDTIDE